MSGATYDDEILISPLEENLADDPYGTTMYAIRNLLHRATVTYGGTMSEHEHQVLTSLEVLVTEVGPTT